MVRQQTIDLGRQRVQIGEIHDADGATADLVLIGRADAAAGRADLGAAVGGRVFADAVQFAVQRQNQRCIVGDAQVFRRDRYALLGQLLDFGEQRMRIDDDAIADHGQLAGAHDARGQKRQLVAGSVDDKCMAGIVTALEAHDDIGTLGEPVDDLALAFITPLRTNHHHIRHFRFPVSCFAFQGARPCAAFKPAHLYCFVFWKATLLCPQIRLFA